MLCEHCSPVTEKIDLLALSSHKCKVQHLISFCEERELHPSWTWHIMKGRMLSYQQLTDSSSPCNVRESIKLKCIMQEASVEKVNFASFEKQVMKDKLNVSQQHVLLQ